MDRITKAVSRAKHEREAVVGHIQSSAKSSRGRDVRVKKIQISHEALRENRIITGEVNDTCSHAYKVLRTRIWQQMRAHGWSTLGVTSANPGEGKSLTAINLAISLSIMEIGKTVVLVDLDMRRPSIHDYFEFWPEYGVSDYLQGSVAIENIMVDPGIGKVLLLPCNVPVANSSEILSSSRIKRLFQEIKACFPSRIVIIDLPPLLYADDVLAFSSNVDTMLFVIEEGKSQADEVSRAVDLLKDVNMVGTVLNKSEDTVSGEGYY